MEPKEHTSIPICMVDCSKTRKNLSLCVLANDWLLRIGETSDWLFLTRSPDMCTYSRKWCFISNSPNVSNAFMVLHVISNMNSHLYYSVSVSLSFWIRHNRAQLLNDPHKALHWNRGAQRQTRALERESTHKKATHIGGTRDTKGEWKRSICVYISIWHVKRVSAIAMHETVIRIEKTSKTTTNDELVTAHTHRSADWYNTQIEWKRCKNESDMNSI